MINYKKYIFDEFQCEQPDSVCFGRAYNPRGADTVGLFSGTRIKTR